MSEKDPPNKPKGTPPDNSSEPTRQIVIPEEPTRVSSPPPLEPTTFIETPSEPTRFTELPPTQAAPPEAQEPTTFLEPTLEAAKVHSQEPTVFLEPKLEATNTNVPQPEETNTHVPTTAYEPTTVQEPTFQSHEATTVQEPTLQEPAQEVDPATQYTMAPAKPVELERTDWKTKFTQIGASLLASSKDSSWLRNLGAKLQNFEPAQAAEWASKKFQRRGGAPYGKAITIALCAFFLADLAALLIGNYIPEPPSANLSRAGGGYRRAKMADDYNMIAVRNLFNSQGLIPGEDLSSPNHAEPDNVPVRTTLPFNLIGTVILQDELRSIATIEDKSASLVYPVRETDEIPSKAKIVKVEARKVIFVNVSSGRLEFVDLPEDPALPTNIPKVTAGAKAGGGIEKVAPNQFNVSRSEVDKALADLNKVLTEARAVPNFENGVANGYKLFQIVPNSIYDKLGLQNGDVIVGLNGAVINDPGKAFEMLSELKTSNHLELQVKKDGKVQNNIYDIR